MLYSLSSTSSSQNFRMPNALCVKDCGHGQVHVVHLCTYVINQILLRNCQSVTSRSNIFKMAEDKGVQYVVKYDSFHWYCLISTMNSLRGGVVVLFLCIFSICKTQSYDFNTCPSTRNDLDVVYGPLVVKCNTKYKLEWVTPLPKITFSHADKVKRCL